MRLTLAYPHATLQQFYHIRLHLAVDISCLLVYPSFAYLACSSMQLSNENSLNDKTGAAPHSPAPTWHKRRQNLAESTRDAEPGQGWPLL